MIGTRVRWAHKNASGEPSRKLSGKVQAVTLDREHDFVLLIEQDDGTFAQAQATDVVVNLGEAQAGLVADSYMLDKINVYLKANDLAEPGDADALATITRVFKEAVADMQKLQTELDTLKAKKLK